VTYNEPNPSAVEHKKVYDIKHLHPFKNKVIPFVLHSIPLGQVENRTTTYFPCTFYRK
jgi:hypothetical protein